VDFLLRPDAVSPPRKITLDGHKQSHLALRLLRREDPKWKYVQVRSGQYLNNLIEQDHRAIKRQCASMGSFKSFRSASITLAGIELAHRIRKKQFSLGRGRYRNFGSLMLKQLWDRALA
jgi:transposase-like protein